MRIYNFQFIRREQLILCNKNLIKPTERQQLCSLHDEYENWLESGTLL